MFLTQIHEELDLEKKKSSPKQRIFENPIFTVSNSENIEFDFTEKTHKRIKEKHKRISAIQFAEFAQRVKKVKKLEWSDADLSPETWVLCHI